ncbi:MAG: zinc-regulated TonB-dependent outer membrane receptor, partial [Candidatus Binatia bacterium]
HDWGFYTQGLYGFAYRWAGGFRAEYASGDGETLETGRGADPFRDDRLRLSPLLTFDPSEFARLRLQYNFDDADHLDDNAHSVWLGLEFLYGVHPAHGY